jgi:uncharacterized repeat protein (TIGR01451 family)
MVAGNRVGKKLLTVVAGAAAAVLLLAVVAVALPPSNTAPPTISDATPVVGQTLTGNDGTWDVDPAETGRTQQWVRCDPSCGAGPVVGSGTTYTVQGADVTKALVYRVSVTNDDGTVAADSAATDPVRQAPANTVAPSIDDTSPAVGQTINASPGTWTGTPAPTFAFAWFRGATQVGSAQAYTVQAADAGQTLFVRVTATNTAGSASADSAATAAVTAPPANTVAPTIDDTSPAVGQTINASPGTWTGHPAPTFAYAWFRGATQVGSAQAYLVQAADAGQTLFVRVTATNATGSASKDSAATAAVVAPPANTAPPTVNDPTPVVGQTLTATTGTWTGFPAPTYTYKWQRCNAAGDPGSCADITDVADATDDNDYTVRNIDTPGAGARLRVVVTAANSAAPGGVSAASAAAGPVSGPPLNTGVAPMVLPSITGTLTAGQTITAAPGTWLGYPAPGFTYGWQRCNAAGDPGSCADITDVADATNGDATYTLRALDAPAAGATIRAVVRGSNPSAANVTAFSPAVGPIASIPINTGQAPMVLPSVTDATNDGAYLLGEVLTAAPGVWLGYPAPTFQFRWIRCDTLGNGCADITDNGDATDGNPTYALRAGDLGRTIRVGVVATNAAGSSPTTEPTRVKSPAVLNRVVSGAPVNNGADGTQAPGPLAGTPARGQTITASSGLWLGYPIPGSQEPPSATLTHQWQRCTDAAASSCTNVGSPIAVNSSNVGAPSQSTSQLVLTDAELGTFLRVLVTAANQFGTLALATPTLGPVVGSPTIPLVDGQPNPDAQPKITGNAQEGLTLSGSTGTWSAYPSDNLTLAIEWLRCTTTGSVDSCQAVPGANADVYTLTSQDVGYAMRLRVTAANGVVPDGVAVSAPTGFVTRPSSGGGGGADLALGVSATSSGDEVTYRVVVRNVGQAGADNVVLNATVASGLTVVSASSTRGGCTGAVSCALGGLAKGDSVPVTITLRASQTGRYPFSATASTSSGDANPSNNTVSTSAVLTVTSRTPTATGGGNTNKPVATPVGTKKPTKLVAKLTAKRKGAIATVAARFRLGDPARLVLTVLPANGKTGRIGSKRLPLLKGSSLGNVKVRKKQALSLTMRTKKATSFVVRLSLSTKLVKKGQIYVIRLQATGANGLKSKLDVAFKG